MSDGDAAFRGNDHAESKLSKHIQYITQPLKLNESQSWTLGVIDVLAKNSKRVLSKEF